MKVFTEKRRGAKNNFKETEFLIELSIMFEAIRNKMREEIRNLEYIMTIHAEEEMENDELSIFDIENAILTGEIVEKQKDIETGEWKYLVGGKTLDEQDIIVAAKLSATDKLVIIYGLCEDFEDYEN